MFDTVLLLAVPALLFRALGAFGAGRFASWRSSAIHGLAVLLLMTGSAHFVPDSVTVLPSHDDLVAMVPGFMPFADFLVYLTGVVELAGAIGLLIPATRPVAGLVLALLFVLMLPANIHAALDDIPLNGDPATPLWFRIPEQIGYIALALWGSGAVSARTRPEMRVA
ncbi:DoxX family protein [Nocardia goodfellowii]